MLHIEGDESGPDLPCGGGPWKGSQLPLRSRRGVTGRHLTSPHGR